MADREMPLEHRAAPAALQANDIIATDGLQPPDPRDGAAVSDRSAKRLRAELSGASRPTPRNSRRNPRANSLRSYQDAIPKAGSRLHHSGRVKLRS
jgi:hypothetical protein